MTDTAESTNAQHLEDRHLEDRRMYLCVLSERAAVCLSGALVLPTWNGTNTTH